MVLTRSQTKAAKASDQTTMVTRSQVQKDDVPKPPKPAAPKPARKSKPLNVHYLIVHTGYTSRIIKKLFQAKHKNDIPIGVSLIAEIDELWGNGIVWFSKSEQHKTKLAPILDDYSFGSVIFHLDEPLTSKEDVRSWMSELVDWLGNFEYCSFCSSNNISSLDVKGEFAGVLVDCESG